MPANRLLRYENCLSAFSFNVLPLLFSPFRMSWPNLVFDGIGELLVDIVTERMAQDGAPLKLFQFRHGSIHSLECDECDQS